jgi:hypothetical protein
VDNAQVIILIRKPEGDGYIEWKANAPLSIFTAKAKKEIKQKLGVTNERI